MKKFIIVFALMLVASRVEADTAYTVQHGDTLYSISKKFNVSLSQLKEKNTHILKSNKLQIGDNLTIPGAADSNKKASQILKNNNKYYIVKKGDTIYKIAKRYSLSESDIKGLNNLNSSKLKVGQKLVVWKDSEPAVSASNRALEEDAKLVLKNLEQDISYDLDAHAEDISKMGIKDRIVAFAQKMLHLPYKFGGNSFMGIDCSAYVQKVYSKVGINIPRSAREQFKVGDSIEKKELSVGDLVFFRTYASFPSHVGIYLGNNLFIHSSSKSKKVTIDNLDAPYYVKRFIGAKRLVTEESFDDSKLIVEN